MVDSSEMDEILARGKSSGSVMRIRKVDGWW